MTTEPQTCDCAEHIRDGRVWRWAGLCFALILVAVFAAWLTSIVETRTALPVCVEWRETLIPEYGPGGALIDTHPAVVCLEYEE